MRRDPIVEAFDLLARREPTAPLVASPSRAASRSDVAAASFSAAAALTALRLPPGTTVLLSALNGAGFLSALLGCRRAGLVPILCDRTAPAAERARIIGALSLAAEITCDTAFPQDTSWLCVSPTLEPPRDGGDAGYVKLTSGSSGEPAGVGLTPEALAADDDQLARTMGLSASDRFVAAIPWSHSYGLSSLVLPALRRGSLLVLPEDGSPWGPIESARRLEATVFPSVPAYLGALCEIASRDAWPSSMRTAISAGAPLSPETAARFRATFGRPVHVFYGASECGGITYDREGGAAERGTVGTPVEGVTIAIEGPDAPGEGRVVVRSAAVASPTGVFVSNDLGTIAEGGELRLLGRADAIINVGGKKVQPREVEAVLLRLPGVRDAVVVGVRADDGGREFVRAVVAADPGRLEYAEIAAWCRRHLASHKVPRSILLVEALPRTERGKVDRAALAVF